jgi:hypothetical protein
VFYEFRATPRVFANIELLTVLIQGGSDAVPEKKLQRPITSTAAKIKPVTSPTRRFSAQVILKLIMDLPLGRIGLRPGRRPNLSLDRVAICALLVSYDLIDPIEIGLDDLEGNRH